MIEKDPISPVISAHEETLILNWKARQLKTSYGKLVAGMKKSDLVKYAKEYEIAMKEKEARLKAEAAERKLHRGEIHCDSPFISPSSSQAPLKNPKG